MSQVAQMAGCQTECVRPSPDNAILTLFGARLASKCPMSLSAYKIISGEKKIL